MTTPQTDQSAIVIGAGIAGLLAARVLSEHYDVTIIENDVITGVTTPRRGVPQGHHVHALLARGQQVLEDLFPGLQDELTENGIFSCDIAGGLRWYFQGKRLAQADAHLLSVSATRPQLEAAVRARVLSLPRISLIEQTRVERLTWASDTTRVTGVVTRTEHGDQTMVADLVIDATGRWTKSVDWLSDRGLPTPHEERVTINLAYTTRLFRLASSPYGTDYSINSVAYPGNMRGAFFPKLSDSVSMLSLTGLLGDHPPRTLEDFLSFADDLDSPEIAAAARTAEPLDNGVTFRIPDSIRRRYDQLDQHPDGYLLIGDAICAFNPVYGQGMTVAALEAKVLQARLAKGDLEASRYYKDLNRIISAAWSVSAGGDLDFPGVSGRPPLAVQLMNKYVRRLHQAAHRNSSLTRAFFRVAGMVDSPLTLIHPQVLRHVALARRQSKDVERDDWLTARPPEDQATATLSDSTATTQEGQ